MTEIIVEAEEAKREASRLLEQATAFTITNADEYRQAAEERARIKTRYNEIDALRKRIKAPILASAKNVDDQFEPPLSELNRAIAAINAGVKGYLEAEEAKRKAEEERQREEARKERERLEEIARVEAAKAEELRQKAAAEAERGRLAAAAKLEAKADVAIERSEETERAAISVPTPIVKSTVTRPAGIGTREHWEFKIEDASQLPREFLMPSTTAIRAYVNAMKGHAKIPGVRIWRDDIVTGRGR